MTFIEFRAVRPLAGRCFNSVSKVHADGFMEVGEGALGDLTAVRVKAPKKTKKPRSSRKSAPSVPGLSMEPVEEVIATHHH